MTEQQEHMVCRWWDWYGNTQNEWMPVIFQLNGAIQFSLDHEVTDDLHLLHSIAMIRHTMQLEDR
jgi:hypothetical protein